MENSGRDIFEGFLGQQKKTIKSGHKTTFKINRSKIVPATFAIREFIVSFLLEMYSLNARLFAQMNGK
jgi:hypothetical protein